MRTAALSALAKMDGPIEVERICALLLDPEIEVQNSAVEVLIKARDPDTVRHLVSILGDENEYARRAAVEVLNEIGETKSVDALAGFRAERGGIRFYAGPALADVQGSLGFWTCADDTAADATNTATWKVCGRINCPPEQTAELQAITMCLTFERGATRIFPELAAANVKLANVAQARLADSALLAQIKAGSTAVTDSGTAWGAVKDLMNTVGRASMYYRDRYRIRNAPLRVIMPSWIIDALRTDLLDGPDWGRNFADHYGVTEATIREFFANRNLNVTFALDSAVPASNGGGFFAAISGAALPAWPTTVEWAMFPEGSWLFLDGGQLDLGVVRDSTLVRTNDYMQFSETFEAAAHIGGESLWITSTIDVSGKYPVGV